MVGRRRVSRPRRTSVKTRAKQVMTDYNLNVFTKDFQSLVSGGEISQVLVDNSSRFGNIPVRIVKIT